MKALELWMIFCMIIIGNMVKSQPSRLPDVDLYTLEGKRISASDLTHTDSLLVLVFWKSNNRQSFSQLLEISDEYRLLNAGIHLKVVGICTDVNGTRSDIKPVVYANDIAFEVYVDKNNDFKRAMNVPDFPYMILVDNNSENINFMGHYPEINEIIHKKLDLRLAVTSAGE